MGVSVWGHLVFGLLYFYIRRLVSRRFYTVFPQAQPVAGHMYQNDPTWGGWS